MIIKRDFLYTTFPCRFGQGSGPIWLDDVGCSGSESCLLSCRNRGIGSHNCIHFEDVAISCSGSRTFSTRDCSSATAPGIITPINVSFFTIFVTFKQRKAGWSLGVRGTCLPKGQSTMSICVYCDYSITTFLVQ